MERDFQICISVPLIIKVIDEEDYPELNEKVKNVKKKKKKSTKEAISIIKKVEELLRGGNKQIMKQWESRWSSLKSLRKAMNSFVVLATDNLIFISR